MVVDILLRQVVKYHLRGIYQNEEKQNEYQVGKRNKNNAIKQTASLGMIRIVGEVIKRAHLHEEIEDMI